MSKCKEANTPAMAPAAALPPFLTGEADVGRPGQEGGLTRGGVQQVSLNAAGIVFADAVLPSDDIAGIEDAGANLIRVHAYPLREGTCGGSSARRYMKCDLDFAAAPDTKQAWMLHHKQLWGRDRLQSVLVILNPFSGDKRGLHVWRSVVEGMLKQAGVRAEMLETTHPGHAVEIARHTDLTRFDGVVAIGGDGIVSEVEG